MLELDTTIMTPSSVFETSGHVARFADWMVKDTKTGDVLRADHLVKNVLEARLAGDKEARGLAAALVTDDNKKKKKKKTPKTTAVTLDDEIVKEYENILAQVILHLSFCNSFHTGFIDFETLHVHPGQTRRLRRYQTSGLDNKTCFDVMLSIISPNFHCRCCVKFTLYD